MSSNTKDERKIEKEDGLKQVAIGLLNRGMAVDQVAKFVDLPISEIEGLRK